MSNTVPDGWAQHRQGEIADFSNGRAYKLTEWEKEGTPVIRLQNLTGSGNEFYYSNLELPERQYCQSGDLLYMWSATFGPHIWKGPKAIYHYHIWKVTPDEINLTKPYLYQLLGYKTDEWLNKSNGMGILHVTKGNMEDLQLNLPPLPEQKKIAAILTSVDTVIEKTQAQIDKLKDLKTGMMQELLTKGIGHTEFKDSPVGRIPVEWGVVTVLELGNGHKDTVQTGPFGAQLHSKDYVEEGIPLVLIKNIKEDGLDDTDIPKITEKDANRLSRYRLKEGDIVFSRVGRVGSCFLCSKNEEGWVFSGQTLRIRFNNSKVDLTYFNYALRTEEIQKELIGESVGSTRSSINTTILESLSVKLPPIQEQKKIASILQSLDSNIKSRELKLKQLMSVKKALMQDLLTGKVRVKV